MAYRIKVIHSIRLIASSQSSLVDNLIKELLNIKFKDCKPCLEYIKFYVIKILNKKLTKIFANIYKFCDGNINTFCLMLKKGAFL